MLGEPNDVRFGEARIIVLDQPTVNTVNRFISPQKTDLYQRRRIHKSNKNQPNELFSPTNKLTKENKAANTKQTQKWRLADRDQRME